ncbi:G-protein coupled receptor Mth2-like [Stegodyphus dumicola]|uniref:G-protein coupled receptor Mth2-like n=1 Tax=Stegodyphus dumicola TaxID=202533 RepID=UPI0015A9E493|nr:G-protein coupled receptor Mth2-like [Stegodyphus dumicola]XP_035226187.1 G-protein coupled receptor Mth2-like [Stegodyphus dumicola]
MFRKPVAAIIIICFFMKTVVHSRTVRSSEHPPVHVHPTYNTTDHSVKKIEYVEHDDPHPDLNCSRYLIEKEYILLENGSLLLPGSPNALEYKTFFLQNDTAFLCVGTEAPIETTPSSPLHYFSKEFLSCAHVLIEPDEYQLLSNGSIYIGIYSKMYSPKNYYIQQSGVYVCVPHYEEMTQNMSTNDTFTVYMNKFSEGFAYVTYIGLLLSIISLVSHLAVFCVVSSVRNLPGCCLASLSISLLIAYFCFITITVPEATEHCIGLGMAIYYFFLTSFFWMNAIAFDVWRSFRVVMKELRISSHRVPWRRFMLYSLYSWLTPGLLIVLVKISDTTEILPEEFRPSFGTPTCWFGQRKALLIFFAVPLCVVMLLNAIFFLDVTYVISRATLKTSQSHEATLKKRFFMFMRLALIMGLTWIVGLIAGYADNEIMWYLFVILNTLQGLFIFVVFSCSSKVRVFCCKKYKKHMSTRGSTSVRTISQVSAAV